MKYQIKQLGLGGILDQAISLLKNHFGLLFGIVALSVVPLNAMIGLLPLMSEGLNAVVLAVVNLIILLLVTPLFTGAMVHAVASIYLSRKTSIGECYQHGLQRYMAVLGTWFLMSLAIMGGLILLIIPGILCAFWFMLAMEVAVLENRSGGGALGRSKALMRGNIGTGFVLGIVLAAINFGLMSGSSMIPQPHVAAITNAIASGITQCLGTCAIVVFYFSCRCKLENFDLQVLADGVGSSAESPAEEEA